ncbi:unnamed protein product [Effrenium voratum]|uniref:Uncharacterized protein n=1 Tax=Effrenium voratum TaxID=2562239 RepID=A0AA36MK65_9DINO|nr:unnamed protein product [Effrenium voratum]CAJ1420182.1 unnamed protein product [Effrenium voratum]
MKKKKQAKTEQAVLAGKVKDLLPEAFDFTKLKAESEDEDGPPEEVHTVSGAGAEPEAQAASLMAAAKDTEKVKRRKDAKAKAKPKAKAKHLWEDPENQELLGVLRQQTQERRQKRAKAARLDKDGVTLQDSILQAEAGQDASHFLTEELFGRRKRKRSLRDRFDRNVLRGSAHPLHLDLKGQKQTAG